MQLASLLQIVGGGVIVMRALGDMKARPTSGGPSVPSTHELVVLSRDKRCLGVHAAAGKMTADERRTLPLYTYGVVTSATPSFDSAEIALLESSLTDANGDAVLGSAGTVATGPRAGSPLSCRAISNPCRVVHAST